MPPTTERLRFSAIGTVWSITTDRPLAGDAQHAISERIETFDAVWSRFRPDSLVSRIARVPGRHAFPDEAGPLFDLYRRLGLATHGRVNPLVGHRLENLGYDAGYSLVASADPVGVPAWDAVARWDGTALTTTEPVLVDVGAAGKGYLVDLVCGVLDDFGVDEYVVDAGGDLRHRGGTPVRVGLEHPTDPSLAIGVIELENAALAASAPNRRVWGDGLHHVIDGVTGMPTRTVAATWALAPTGLEADGLATALFFAGPDELVSALPASPFEAVRMLASGSVETTPFFEPALFFATAAVRDRSLDGSSAR
ncbi:FAD:protein FMN transferase [Frondihabitans cladoniiphilus]|uniref:FAD:protein FMN transferase n=1 Tax=Frondihabitans cladoniiphilus TaxID=715785 RepID=A0ABP8VZ76_9MICO